MLSPSDYTEELRQRAVRILEEAQKGLRIRAENTTGRMAPHVVAERIRSAARITERLNALAQAAEEA